MGSEALGGMVFTSKRQPCARGKLCRDQTAIKQWPPPSSCFCSLPTWVACSVCGWVCVCGWITWATRQILVEAGDTCIFSLQD